MDKDLLVQYIEEGLTTWQIATRESMGQSTVRYWLKKHGLKTNHSPVGRRKWTDEQLLAAVPTAETKSDILKALGLKPTSGNYVTLAKYVHRLGIDISHLKGIRSGRGGGKRKPLNEILIEGSTYNRANLKRRLQRKGLLDDRCAICGLGTEWKGQPLVLVMDHINGVNNDHRLENLRMLCPNCNSQQPTFSSRGRGSQFPK